MSTQPTDAEIDELWRFEASKNWDSTLAMRTSFARAVLAKWGQPAVAVEPVAYYEYNADLDAWFLAYSHNPKAKTRPLVFGDTAPQPSTAAQGDALSDSVRTPLDSLHADAAYLIGRLRDGSMPYVRVIEIIRERIDAASPKAQAAPTNPHWDYLKRYWQMGFDGVSLDACTGDAPIKAWHEGKAARASATPAAQAAQADSVLEDVCHAPPPGWRCTRKAGHEGPCAAVEYEDDKQFVERGMQRIRDAEDAAQKEGE